MAKLIFKYATMGSGKSTALLQIDKNYEIQGFKGLLFIPSVDGWSGGYIRSRLGIEKEAMRVDRQTNIFNVVEYLGQELNEQIDYILVDEANFLTKEQVKQLGAVVDEMNINVICFGITTDFRGELFEGTKALFEEADKKEEIDIRTICWCGRKATHHARVIDGEMVLDGDVIIPKGSKVEYYSLCRKHYKKGKFCR